jgi:hypothetical protein
VLLMPIRAIVQYGSLSSNKLYNTRLNMRPFQNQIIGYLKCYLGSKTVIQSCMYRCIKQNAATCLAIQYNITKHVGMSLASDSVKPSLFASSKHMHHSNNTGSIK